MESLSDKSAEEPEPSESEIGTGEESKAEIAISNFLAKVIHLFLSVLSVLLLTGAAVAAFETVVRDLVSPNDLLAQIETDGAIGANALTFDFVTSLESQVWGQGFAAPSFTGAFNVIEQRVVGEKHLKLKLSLGGSTFDAIRFGSADALNPSIDAVFRPSINEFRGAKTLQLMIDHTA